MSKNSTSRSRWDRLAEELARLNVEISAIAFTILISVSVAFLTALGLKVEQIEAIREVSSITLLLLLTLLFSYAWYILPGVRVFGGLSCGLIAVGFYQLNRLLAILNTLTRQSKIPLEPLISPIEENILLRLFLGFAGFFVPIVVFVSGFIVGWMVSKRYVYK